MARKPDYHQPIWHGGSQWFFETPSTIGVQVHDGPRSVPIGFARQKPKQRALQGQPWKSPSRNFGRSWRSWHIESAA